MTTKIDDNTLIYNALDAAITLECANAFMPDLLKEPAENYPTFESTYDHTIDLFEPLMYMMIRGVRVEQDKLAETRVKINTKLDELQKEIDSICGRYINPNSPKDTQTYFYVEKRIPPYFKRNLKGKSVVTTDDKALQRIARGTANRKGLKEANLMQQWRGLRKLRGTYIDIVFDKDSRLRCSYNPRGTKFGRLSSSKTVFETGMNMQNLPEAFKGFILADEDKIFIDLDKRHAEWIIVAYECGDLSMINACENNIDVHAYTASQMFNVSVELIQKEDEYLGHGTDPEAMRQKRVNIPEIDLLIRQNKWIPRSMSMRQAAKKANHGLNYDEGYKTFSLDNEITEKEGKVVVDFYHGIYPGIRQEYTVVQQELANNNRTLLNLFGRPCRFLDKWGDKLFKAAYSYKPQSTVGELVNRAIVKTYRDSSTDTEDLEILAQVHDNVLYQNKVDALSISRAVFVAKEHLNPTLSTGGREFQIATDMKIGYDWGNLHKVLLVDNLDDQVDLVKEVLDGIERT